MRIDLKKLSGVYGSKIPFAGQADLSAEAVYGEYPFQQPVRYEGEIVNHLGVLKLTAGVQAVYSTHCARCLCRSKRRSRPCFPAKEKRRTKFSF